MFDTEPGWKVTNVKFCDKGLEQQRDSANVDMLTLPHPTLITCPHCLPIPRSIFAEELEAELLEQELSPDVDPDLDSDLETDLEIKPELKLPSSKSEPMFDTEPEWQVSNVKFCDKALEQQRDSVSPFSSYKEQNLSLGSLKSNHSCLNSVEEEQLSIGHHSVSVQTYRHLFWAEKHIQASEHSIERATLVEPSKNITDMKTSRCTDQESVPNITVPNNTVPNNTVPNNTLSSKKQLLSSKKQLRTKVARSSQTLSSPCLSSSSLPSAIGLADLVNLASSLVMASSTKDLPNLEHLIKAPSQKTMDPTKEPAAQPIREELKLEKPTDVPPENPSEKPLKADEPQEVQKGEDTNSPGACLGFNKPGIKRATIEGKVNFLQPLALALSPQGDRKDSVPGTEKRSPLLLKIDFKLASYSSPKK
ncbi:spermatogenesis-associated protein 32 [Orycteropus afer afer]|uniref:Spermatogenesis-associated protein 32 n=1 Tax=Orycteropus afer afer TaxID=1230840 RepID=A0A8B7B437_ORYAF|nr:spermatogenesis-associated protein 32 [Orycteropus afer afer]